MRNCLISAAAILLLAGVLVSRAGAAPLSAAYALKAAPNAVTEVGCRANGRGCPIGRQQVCKDGHCSCKPCPY